jgi:hypothetical protein
MSRFGVWWMAEPNRSPTVDTAAGQPLSKVFDIGMFIPHIGPNHPLLLGILLLTSSSQGHFGVASVEIQTNAGTGPVAVALQLVTNPQLNCGDISFFPVPMPTGVLLAPNTVVAGLTLGDLIAGFLSMLVTTIATAAIGFLLNKLGGPLVKWTGGKIFNLVDDLVGRMIMRLPDRFFRAYFQGTFMAAILHTRFGTHADKLFDMLLGWAVGSPTGYAISSSPSPLVNSLGWIQDWADGVGKSIDQHANQWGINDYLNNTALVPTYPYTVPAPVAEVPLSLMQAPLNVAKSVADPAANTVEPVSDFLEKLFTGKSH